METVKRRRYSLQFKLAAVHFAKDAWNISALARALHIPDQTLHRWIKADNEGKLRQAQEEHLRELGTLGELCLPIKAAAVDLRDELRLVQQQLAHVTMERDTLKSQVAWLSGGMGPRQRRTARSPPRME
jgi:transposase-like protein